MRKPLGVLVFCVSLAGMGAPLFAGPRLEDKVRQRIDLDLVEASAPDVFASFARMLGAELDLSPAVTGKVTVRLQNVMLETALDAVCDSIGCRSELRWGEVPSLRILPVVPQSPDLISPAVRQSLDSPVSVSLKDAAAMDVLVSLSRMLSAELEIQGGSSQTVTLELQGVPASQALDALAAILKVDWDLREENGDGKARRVLWISPRKAIPPIPSEKTKP